jgi:hypothetical protein
MEETKTTENARPDEEVDEILKHHEQTGTSSVKKLDPTPPPKAGKLENSEDEEDDVPVYGAGGSRPGIGLPDHSSERPRERMVADGVLRPNGKDSK